jgi:hypothetical protein
LAQSKSAWAAQSPTAICDVMSTLGAEESRESQPRAVACGQTKNRQDKEQRCGRMGCGLDESRRTWTAEGLGGKWTSTLEGAMNWPPCAADASRSSLTAGWPPPNPPLLLASTEVGAAISVKVKNQQTIVPRSRQNRRAKDTTVAGASKCLT